MANLTRSVVQKSGVIQRAFSTTIVKHGGGVSAPQWDKKDIYSQLGDREIVGHGFNGQPTYMDREDFPCPAVRWGENTPENMALWKKEKGDWKALSVEEKKALYRASFRQTFSEMSAPTGEWKTILATVILGITVTGWAMIWLKWAVYPALPRTINEEWKIEMAKRMIVQRQGAVEGISAEFDYEKNQWK